MEEPGNLEIENQNIAASPKNANAFSAPPVEFEYGVTAWWTAEAYVQGKKTVNDSAVFTGFRFENRFRPLPREYSVNPVLYLEYEDHNEADKSFLEITDHDSITDVEVPNGEIHKEIERAIEGKLILSSNVKGWKLSENIIAEKAVNEAEPWEFGYALPPRDLWRWREVPGGTPSAGRILRRAANYSAGWERGTALGCARRSSISG